MVPPPVSADLELRQLRMFVAVVEAETLTRAAQTLGVAQSTVSDYAQKMLSLEREARAGVAAVGDRASSTLVVGTVESVSAYLLPPLVTALQRTWPKLRVNVEIGNCADIRRWVKSGQIDVGLLLERGSRRTEERVLLRTPLVCFKAPRANEGSAETMTAETLRKGVFFFSDRAGTYHQIVREQFRATGFPAPTMNGLGTIEAVKRTVLRTAGAYGVLPGFAVSEDLQSNQFETVALRPPLDQLELKGIQAGRQEPLSPVVRQLFERLESSAVPRAKDR
ncbi:MAG: LysR family transcriptional regulator [Deltaproteobacteria bacterium]|nr:MAG: LysR family transcriptional regulator [Deltaproteobacteria bacterium]